MSDLKQLEHLLIKARRKQAELDTINNEIHKLLNNMKVNLESSTEAENAICLDEAINCYIQYNEYDLTNIMKEIKENMKMNVYVLKSIPYPVNNFHIWDGYYVGKTYRYEGEEYAICDIDVDKAKKYQSRKRAENACNSLFEKVCNYEFEVEEIEI